jgi:tetratricopeptide (TPR) repeat protein
MKPAAMTVVMLAVTTCVLAQQPAPGQQNQPAAQPGTAQKGASAPAPVGKRPPQAKTQPEFDAYKAAIASQNDLAALDKAADDFAAKFPASELRIVLFRAEMRGYQNANNGDKVSEAAQKILKIDPDDPEALVNVAEGIAERTRDTDLDKDQRWDEAATKAQHALETVDADVPAGLQPNQIELYQGLIRSNAYSILGSVADHREKYPDAENYYRKSIEALPSQPDSVVILRLALALDKQGKYADALKEASRAVDLTQESTSAGKVARQERDRLVQLTGGSNPAPGTVPPAGTTPNSTQSPH